MAFTVLEELHKSYIVQGSAAVSLNYAALLQATSIWNGTDATLHALIAQLNDLHHQTIEHDQITCECVQLCLQSQTFMGNLCRGDIVRQCTEETHS